MRPNPRAVPRIQLVDGRVPLLVVDDFYDDPDDVRALALRCDFTDAGGYPGTQAKIDRLTPVVFAALDRFASLISRCYGTRVRRRNVETDFATISMRPEDLRPQQMHPHVDHWLFSGLLYLTPGSESGTNFFRFRRSGKVTLDTPVEIQNWLAFINDPMNAPAGGGYVIDGNEHWELVHRVPGYFNRLLCFPTNIFHSGDVGPYAGQSELVNQRITQRFLALK
jgi:hypothetical protein